VRAPAVAGSVLELGGVVHVSAFLFFHSWKSFCFCLCSCFSSGCSLLLDRRFRPGPDGPNEAQQLAPHGRDDLSSVLACRLQPAVTLVKAVLRLPGDLWFRQLELAPFDGLIWPHLKACDLLFRVGLGGRSPKGDWSQGQHGAALLPWSSGARGRFGHMLLRFEDVLKR
jgi:hypothetical protein